jgi:iron(III) transport system substrate-binding protein
MSASHRLLLLSLLGCTACSDDATEADGPAPVTLYVALDETHSRRLIEQFERETGIPVRPRFDTEASKTVGLVSAIVEEASRPRCDVFWNNELAHSARLAQKGLLAAYDSPAAAGIPARFRDPGHRWTAFAARARVLIVNRELLPDPADWPDSIQDLCDPKWKGRCAVAKPLTGTTLTHFTALRQQLGEKGFQAFIDGLFRNEVRFLQSNGATMRETAAGKIAFALTDTDDYHVALTKGHPVGCVFPDQQPDGLGTMLIPNSVAIVAGGPNPDGARRLVDWILRESTEALLAAAMSAQIPVRASVPGPAEASIRKIGAFREMTWDAERVGADLERCAAEFGRRFGG